MERDECHKCSNMVACYIHGQILTKSGCHEQDGGFFKEVTDKERATITDQIVTAVITQSIMLNIFTNGFATIQNRINDLHQ